MFKSVIPLGERFHFLMSLWNYIEDDPEIKKIYTRQLEKLEQWVEQAKIAKEIRSQLPTQWVVSLFDA